MIYTIFNTQPSLDYADKISFIKSKKIALWDVIENCQREGSLDSNIREEKVNDFRSLFRVYPNIKTVMFNGGKAYETYKKWVGFDAIKNLTYLKLTSSSPANTKKLGDKLKEWSAIRELI
jgi:G:T/U mismatch-specific DNA glycosylase